MKDGLKPGVAQPETLMGQMKRDLEAWELAKAVIARAKAP